MNQPVWWVGIDLGTERHEACVLDGRGKIKKKFTFSHDPKGFASMVEILQEVTEHRLDTIAAAMENNHGLVCEILLGRRAEVYSINPKQLDRFRDRYNVAGAKDDKLDALVLADSLRTDTCLYNQVKPLPDFNLLLRTRSRTLAETDEVFRQQANRLWSQICQYFPVLLKFCHGADEQWLWELLKAAGTPKKIETFSERRIGAILKQFQIRRFSAEELREALVEGGLSGDPRVADFCEEHVQMLVEQLTLLRRQRASQEKKIRQLLETEETAAAGQNAGKPEEAAAGAALENGESGVAPEEDRRTENAPGRTLTDAEIVLSMTGIGWKTGAVLLGEACHELNQANYRALRGISGVAPVTKRSGKKSHVEMRRACNYRIRQALHHSANVAVLHVKPWKAIYARIRSQGGSHARAIRQIADKMLKVLCSMLKSRTLFDLDRMNGKSLPVN